MITKSNLDYLFSIKGNEENLSNIMFTLFNKKKVEKPDGSFDIYPAMFEPWEEIEVKKNQLENISYNTKTTVGRYIFNVMITNPVFGAALPYINEPLDKKRYGNLFTDLSNMLLMDKITSQQFAQFQENIIWLNNFTEILIPGVTMNLLILPEEIKAELQRLILANKEAVINNDIIKYVNNVEKPILAFAKKWYKENDPSGMQLYSLKKPSFDNNFKNMFIEVGAIKDIATGKFVISTGNFNDGINPEEYNYYANQAVNASFSRGVSTQYAGAKVKEFATAFESLVIDPGTDCGNKRYISIAVTEDNVNDVIWRWIDDGNDGILLLTPDNIGKYMGKTVKCRTPLYCKSENICEKCAGDLYKRINVDKAGLTLLALTSRFLNTFLKLMHDTTVDTRTFDPFDYLYEV
jgi:hypothetical protein